MRSLFFSSAKKILLFCLIASSFIFLKAAYSSIPIENSIYDIDKNIEQTLEEELSPHAGGRSQKTEPKQGFEEYELYHKIGVTQYLSGEYEKAIEKFKKAVKLNESFAKGYNNLGLSYFKLRRLKEAVAAFENAIKCNPDYFEAYNNLGSAFLDMGKYDRAIENFNLANNIFGESSEVAENLKLAHELKKKRQVNAWIFLSTLLLGLAFIVVKLILKNR